MCDYSASVYSRVPQFFSESLEFRVGIRADGTEDIGDWWPHASARNSSWVFCKTTNATNTEQTLHILLVKSV